MDVKIVEKDSVTVCYIAGDIDINSAPMIKKHFERIISGKKPRIVINFKDVSYIDSSGLATLVEFLKHIKLFNGKLKLSNMSQKIKSLFEITKLEKLFEIKQEEQEAISSFA